MCFVSSACRVNRVKVPTSESTGEVRRRLRRESCVRLFVYRTMSR